MIQWDTYGTGIQKRRCSRQSLIWQNSEIETHNL